MATQGPLFPATVTTAAVDTESANDWVSASSVGANDGTEAVITAPTYDASDISFRLLAQGFGFTIPAGATINGITVEIEKDIAAGAARDFRVQLLDAAGALVGANKATATAWPSSPTIATYGGAADTWTASPTVAMVNDPDFGVVLSVEATAANTDIGVDFIRVTITYTPDPNVTVTPTTAALTLATFVATVTATGPFEDNFESNDLGKWTTVSPGVGTIATGTGSAHEGTYGVHIAEAADSSTSVYMRKAVTATDRIRASGWFRSPTEGAAGNNNASLRFFAAGVRIVDVYRQNDTGGLWLRTRTDAGGSVFTNTGEVRATNVWYQFDVLIEYNGVGTVSRIEVKVDGVTKIDASTFDLDSGGYDEVQLGAEHTLQYVDLDADQINIDRNPPAGMTVTPGVANLILTTFAPTVTAPNPQLVTPGVASLTLTTFAPVVGFGVNAIPTTASLTLSTFAPTVAVSDHQLVTPTPASLALTAFAPTVATPRVVVPDVAALTLATFAPTVTGGAGQTITPTPASLALTAFAPNVVASDHQLVTPTTAALSLTAFAPVVSAIADVTVTPDPASLTLTAFAPNVTGGAGLTVVPSPASLVMTAFAPDVVLTDHQTVTPSPAALAMTAFAPNVVASDTIVVTPTTASLVLTTFPPTIPEAYVPLPEIVAAFIATVDTPIAAIAEVAGVRASIAMTIGTGFLTDDETGGGAT